MRATLSASGTANAGVFELAEDLVFHDRDLAQPDILLQHIAKDLGLRARLRDLRGQVVPAC
jgi:hypothetical protein